MPKAKESGLERYKDMLGVAGTDAPDDYFRPQFEKFMNAIKSDELDAVQRYTGSAYEEINDYLRAGKMGSGEDPEMEQLINNIENGLGRFKLAENLVVSRKSGDDIFSSLQDANGNRVRFEYGETPQEFVNKINHYVGSKVMDDGFTSTSTSRDVWNGRVWFEIQLPKGTNCAYIRPISWHSSEREVILNRGTQYQIVSARTQMYNGSVRPIVTLKVVSRQKYDA